MVVVQLNDELSTLTLKVSALVAAGARAGGGHEQHEPEPSMLELQRQFDDLQKETESLRAELEEAKTNSAIESVDQARAHEWSLRTLETEIEAQAQWRQNVAELLQKRLDEKSKEADALRAENDELKANTIASAFNHADAKKTEGSLRSLEAEMEAQAQWRQRVAEDLERQLDDKTVEADSLRAEVLAARSEADAAELRAKLLTLEATATEAPTRIEELNAAAAAAAAATDEDTMHKAGEDDAVHLSASR